MLPKEIMKKSFSFSHAWLIFSGAFALISAQSSAQQNVDTLSTSDFNLQEIVVSAPVMQVTNSKQEISHAELNRDNTGQNLPYLLTTTLLRSEKERDNDVRSLPRAKGSSGSISPTWRAE